MRRPDESPPEVRALVADRLQYVLGAAGPRRSRGRPPDRPSDRPSDQPEEDGRGPVEDGPGPVEELDDDQDPVRDRPFSRAHLAVVTVLVLVGLLGAGWALFRARPVAVAAPSELGVAPVSAPPAAVSASAASGAGTPAAEAEIVVHVIGAVRRPGLVRLTEGARVQDALEAAGGLTGAARPGQLNLAQPLSDGQQVVIGGSKAGEPDSEVRDGSAPPGTSAGSRAASTVDLNRATAAELEALPGVGPVTAAAVLAWRSQHGRFAAVTELQEVDGIGPKTYAQIAPHVRV